MIMKPFAIKIHRWFEASYEVPVASVRRNLKPENKHMNFATILTGRSACRHSEHPRHHRRHSRHSRCVYLEFVHPHARHVAVAGSFNDWRPAATPMVPMGRGWWVKGLVLPPGRYEYRLLVDGQWMPDPNAAEAAPTPDGKVNSVLVVPAEPVVAQARPAAPVPVAESKELCPSCVMPGCGNLPEPFKHDSFSPRKRRQEDERLAAVA